MSDWLDYAERFPLRFAQVREDPRLDLEMLNSTASGGAGVIVASGGETAALLQNRSKLTRLHLVDANPAQLALTRLKLHLGRLDPGPDRIMALLGHREMDAAERASDVLRLLDDLKIDPAIFGPSDAIGVLGLDHAGRYELLFAQLRNRLRSFDPALQRWLMEAQARNAARMIAPDSELGSEIDSAFDAVMDLPNLVRLFGEDATQNPRMPFARHFATQTRSSLQRFAPRQNPFLWQIFAGRFPPGQTYDWLSRAGATPACRPPEMETVFHHGMMREVLDSLPAAACGFVHLSNLLDWLTPEEATSTLASTARVLRTGGYTIIRQLNSSLDIRGLPGEFDWEEAPSASLLERDRSFFYRAIHVGRRR
jgi:S-adenosylmethionine-diacylglycerol 3-amino-3-carboxypropyl transferase